MEPTLNKDHLQAASHEAPIVKKKMGNGSSKNTVWSAIEANKTDKDWQLKERTIEKGSKDFGWPSKEVKEKVMKAFDRVPTFLFPPFCVFKI